jgi:hypothetical protein
MSSLARRAVALAPFVWAGINLYFWEFLRSAFYERILRAIERIPNMIGDYLSLDSVLRLTVSLAFVALGVWLVWRTDPRRAAKRMTPTAGAVGLARIEAVETGAQTLVEQLKADFRSAVESLDADKIKGRLEKLESMRDYDFKQVDTRFSILCTAVRARDMIALLEKNDVKIRDLGSKLLAARAEDYPNRTKWLSEYGTWREIVEWTDQELNQWPDWAKYNKPFLHLTSKDFEKVPQLPPDTIKPSDGINTVTPYQILCSVMPRWADDFPNIMLTMKTRANTLAG